MCPWAGGRQGGRAGPCGPAMRWDAMASEDRAQQSTRHKRGWTDGHGHAQGDKAKQGKVTLPATFGSHTPHSSRHLPVTRRTAPKTITRQQNSIIITQHLQAHALHNSIETPDPVLTMSAENPEEPLFDPSLKKKKKSKKTVDFSGLDDDETTPATNGDTAEAAADVTAGEAEAAPEAAGEEDMFGGLKKKKKSKKAIPMDLDLVSALAKVEVDVRSACAGAHRDDD